MHTSQPFWITATVHGSGLPTVRRASFRTRQCHWHATKRGRGPTCRLLPGLMLGAVAAPCRNWRRSPTVRLAISQRTRAAKNAVSYGDEVSHVMDPSTGSQVVLLKCIHYHPQSVKTVREVTQGLTNQGALGAVILETCSARWKKTVELQPTGSPMRTILDNEMQTAAEIAEAAGRPVIFGDQKNERIPSFSSALQEGLMDLCSPLDGGWLRSVQAISEGFQRWRSLLRVQGGGGDSKLLRIQEKPEFAAGMPLTYFRYILSAILRDARWFLVALFVVTLFLVLPHDSLASAVFVFICELLTIRAILSTAMVDERDEVLAQAVRQTCDSLGAPAQVVVVIIGAAHHDGVLKRILQKGFESDTGSQNV